MMFLLFVVILMNALENSDGNPDNLDTPRYAVPKGALFHLSVEISGVGGDANATVTWWFKGSNGTKVQISPDNDNYVILNKRSLWIKRMSSEREGFYTCVSKIGNKYLNNNFRVVMTAKYIVPKAAPFQIYAGSPNGNAKSTATWWFKGSIGTKMPINNSDYNYIIFKNNSLLIKRMTAKLEGEYTSVFKLRNKSYSKYFTVVMSDKYTVSKAAPLELNVVIPDGDADSRVTWWFEGSNGTEVQLRSNVQNDIIFFNNSFKIKRMTKEREGVYTCVYENKNRSYSKYFTVEMSNKTFRNRKDSHYSKVDKFTTSKAAHPLINVPTTTSPLISGSGPQSTVTTMSKGSNDSHRLNGDDHTNTEGATLETTTSPPISSRDPQTTVTSMINGSNDSQRLNVDNYTNPEGGGPLLIDATTTTTSPPISGSYLESTASSLFDSHDDDPTTSLPISGADPLSTDTHDDDTTTSRPISVGDLQRSDSNNNDQTASLPISEGDLQTTDLHVEESTTSLSISGGEPQSTGTRMFQGSDSKGNGGPKASLRSISGQDRGRDELREDKNTMDSYTMTEEAALQIDVPTASPPIPDDDPESTVTSMFEGSNDSNELKVDKDTIPEGDNPLIDDPKTSDGDRQSTVTSITEGSNDGSFAAPLRWVRGKLRGLDKQKPKDDKYIISEGAPLLLDVPTTSPPISTDSDLESTFTSTFEWSDEPYQSNEDKYTIPEDAALQLDDMKPTPHISDGEPESIVMGMIERTNEDRSKTHHLRCRHHRDHDEDSKTTTPEPIDPKCTKKPEFRIMPKDTTQRYGRSLLLHCKTSGKPEPEIKWYIMEANGNWRHLEEAKGSIHLFKNGSLKIEEMDENYIGLYRCVSKNILGSIKKTVRVNMTENPWFLTEPSDAMEHRGKSLFIDCETTGRPPPDLNWFKIEANGQWRHLGEEKCPIRIFENGTLKINQMDEKFKGQYICISKNCVGSINKTVTVNMSEKPKWLTEPECTIKLKDEMLLLHCLTTGNPPPEHNWYKTSGNGNFKHLHDVKDSIHVYENGTLQINEMDDDLIGEYTCIAKNNVGSIQKTVKVKMNEKPWFLTEPTDVNQFKDKPLFIDCETTGRPRPDFKWYKIEGYGLRHLEEEKRTLHIYKNGTLKIYHMNEKNIGRYNCISKNCVGSINKTVTVDLIEKPTFVVPPVDTNALKHEKLLLDCKTTARPPPEIIWFKIEDNEKLRLLETTLHLIHIYKNGTLQINEMNDNYRGQFVCVSQNSVGSINKTVTVNLKEKPIFLKEPMDTTKPKGERLILECETTGTPLPEVNWYKYGANGKWKHIEEVNGLVHIYENGNLRINAMDEPYMGLYKCVSNNSVGSINKRVTVKMTEAPRFLTELVDVSQVKGEVLLLHCNTTGQPPPDRIWSMINDEGQQVSVMEEGSSFRVFDNGTLKLEQMDEHFMGKYTCVSSNSEGSINKTVTVTMTEMPSFLTELEDVTQPKGEKLILHCNTTGKPPPEYNWSINVSGTLVSIKKNQNLVHLYDNGTLEIDEMDESFMGEYTCVSKNSVGSIKKTIMVEMTEKPRFLTEMVDVTQAKGEMIILQCNTTGRPPPDHNWYTINDEGEPTALMEETNSIDIYDNGTLEIYQMDDRFVGKYMCISENYVGSINKTVMVKMPETTDIVE